MKKPEVDPLKFKVSKFVIDIHARELNRFISRTYGVKYDCIKGEHFISGLDERREESIPTCLNAFRRTAIKKWVSGEWSADHLLKTILGDLKRRKLLPKNVTIIRVIVPARKD